jgi:hypothetical protein
MGTWGLGTFDDDIACDWLEDLFDSDPFAFFVQCLDLPPRDDLEFLACTGVVCTAEMVHGLIREPRGGLPGAALLWIEQHRELNVRPLVPAAIAGLHRVIHHNSEMHVRWEDHQELYASWLERISELVGNLESIGVENA